MPVKYEQVVFCRPSELQLALYRLIWERFLASQLMPAVYDTVSADIVAGDCVFRAQGQTLKFKGFTAVYVESREEEEAASVSAIVSGRWTCGLRSGDGEAAGENGSESGNESVQGVR